MKIVTFSGSKFAQFLTRTGLVLTISALSARAGSSPPNDNFADRTALTGQTALVSTYNNNATVETGDPSLGDRALTRTLWWSWTAPYTGWANFSTFGSNGRLVVGVFVGDSLSELSSVGVSNGGPWYLRYGSLSYGYFSSNYQPMAGDSVNIPVESGKTYQIEVAAPAFSTSSIGRVILGINQTPTILSSSVVSGTTGSSLSYQISAGNWPTTYDAQGLPGGLTVDPYSGIISGKPTAVGSFDAVVSATGPGGTGQATVRFEITQANTPATAPVFTSGYAIDTGMIGTPLSVQVYTSGATQITTGTLPPGLTFADDSSSGYAYLSGTPSQAGSFTVPIHASNSVGTTDAQITFQIRKKPPLPAFYSAAVTYGAVGKSFSCSLYASDMTNGTYTVGTLPAGLQLSGTTTISGAPTEAGTFEIPVTATNAAGSTSATLTIVVADAPAPTPTPVPTAPPVITSSAGVNALGGTSFYYSVSSNDPTAQYSASGLPDGLSIDPTSGLISGVATTSGTYTANITATNAIGSTTTPLTLAIQGFNPFALTSPAMATGSVGTRFTYSFISASYYYGYPQGPVISLAAADLPPGLTYTPATFNYSNYSDSLLGTISGIPTTTGTYYVPFTATLGRTTLKGKLTLVLSPATLQQPLVTSPASAHGNVGQSFSYTIRASNFPTSYSTGDLPPGLSLNATTGLIQGIPTQAGTYVVDLGATNTVGSAKAKLTISIGATPPVQFNTPTAAEGTVGAWFYGYVYYSDPRSGSAVTLSGLPAGTQFTSYGSSGSITGTPTTSGTYPVKISVTDSAGTWTTTETIVIHPTPPPVITSNLMAVGNTGSNFYYYPYSSDSSSTIQIGKLPSGLAFTYGSITGTPSVTGTFPITISATDAAGSCTAEVLLQIDPPKPPGLWLPAAYHAYTGADLTYYIDGYNTITSSEISGRLPAGVTFDSANLRLIGTPAEAGSFPLQITVSGPGGSVTAPFTLEVDPLPLPVISTSLVVYTSPTTYTYNYIQTSNYWNSPTLFAAQGLPAGLKLSTNSSIGFIEGIISSTGTFPVTITATNYSGSSSAVVNFTTDSSLSSGFYSTMTAATVGESFNYYLYSGNASIMANRTYTATNLPPGLAIDSSTGRINGTPTTAGTYAVNIAAAHSTYATMQFTLEIVVNSAPERPVLVSSDIASGVVSQPFDFWMYTNNETTSYAIDAAPPGLSLNSKTGELKGIPTTAGTYRVKISAANAGGTRTAEMIIQIAGAPPVPVFSSSAGLQGIAGDTFSSYLYASNSPTSFSAIGLPPGLALDAATGEISGTPTLAGHYSAEISATNMGGTTTTKLTIDILAAEAPVITSYSDVTCPLGSSFSFWIRASHSPILFTASGLPPGLSLDSKTGTISGTPTSTGDYAVSITASNAMTFGTGTLTIHVSRDTAGLLTSAAEAQGVVGQDTSIPLYSPGYNTTFSAENLPPGLELPEGSTAISGTPTTAGRYEVTVHLTTGSIETKSILTVEIANAPALPPLIAGPVSGWVGSGFRYALNVSNQPTRITADNLPEGLTLDPSTGVISGTPKVSGSYEVTITAMNAVGTSTAVVTLMTIAPQVLVVTTSANLYAATNKFISLSAPLSTNYYYYPYYPYRYPYSLASALGSIITVAGLPPGLIFDSATGGIEGTATKPGDYPLAITATTPLATTTTYSMLHVTDTLPIASSTLQVSSGVYLNAIGAVGSPFQLGLPSIGLATDVVCSGLPEGLNLQKTAVTSNGNPAVTATITGSPLKAGTYPVKFTFSNSTQTASGTVTIVVPDSPELPSFSGSLAASGVVGRSFSYYVGDGSGYATSSSVSLNNAASTGDGISMISVSGLPPGLQFNSSSNFITGTPTAPGSYVVPISLTNSGGTTSASVLITIADQQLAVPQLLGSGGSLGAGTVSFAGEPIHLSLNAANSTTNIAASGLPDGVTLGQGSDGSWTLSGTPAAAGIYNLFLTATSNQGTETVPLTLNVRQLDQSVPPPQPDAIPSPTPVSTPPTVVVNQPRVDTMDDQVTVRGRVLAYQPGCTVTVKAGAQSWQKLRVSPDGSFKLNLANLPVGITHVTIRTRDSSGNVRVARLLVHRHIG